MAEHLDFTTVKEGLSEYEVENGQILKTMTVLTDITLVEKDGKKIPMMGLNELSIVITDIPMDTSDMQLAKREEVTEKDEVKELTFKPLKEIVNIYETPNYLFLVPTIVGKIFLTSKKDDSGSPILRYTFLMKVNTVDKKALYTQAGEPQTNK